MKSIAKPINLMLLIFISVTAAAQKSASDTLTKERYASYQSFLGQISQVNFSNAASNVSLDIQEQSKVKFDISYNYSKNNNVVRNFGTISGTIGSNDNILKGNFLPQLELSYGGYVLLNKKSGLWFRNSDMYDLYKDRDSDFRKKLEKQQEFTKLNGGTNNVEDSEKFNEVDSNDEYTSKIRNYVFQRMNVKDANQVFLSWLNYGGAMKYNENRALDTSVNNTNFKKEMSGKMFLQLNTFFMPSRMNILKNNNILITASARYDLEFDGNNSSALQRVDVSSVIKSDSLQTASVKDGEALIGDFKTGLKNQISLTFFAGINLNSKFLLGVHTEFLYYSIRDKLTGLNDSYSELTFSLALGNTVDPDILKALQGIKVVPYIKLRNIVALGSTKNYIQNNREFGIATIFPINTFIPKEKQ